MSKYAKKAAALSIILVCMVLITGCAGQVGWAVGLGCFLAIF